MTADRHRRDAYASAGARASQRQTPPIRRSASRDLAGGTGPITRGHRRQRHRRRSGVPTLVLAVGLVLGFVVIVWLLLSRDRPQFDPLVAVGEQLRVEAPATFEADELDGIGRRLVTERLAAGHADWFASARASGGDQRAVMAAYWDAAAAELAADPRIQDAYRRAGMSFVFRRQWFGTGAEEPEPAAAAPEADPEPAATPGPTPATPAPAPAAEPEAAPPPEPQPEGQEAEPAHGPEGINRLM